MGSTGIKVFSEIFIAPIGKFRLVAISSDPSEFFEEEPWVRDFQTLREAKQAADKKAASGMIAEVYDSEGEFIYQGSSRAR